MATKTERKPATFRLEYVPVSELENFGFQCVWEGCSVLNFADIPADGWIHNSVLCPRHTQALDDHLKDTGRKLNQPPAGRA